MKIRGFYSDRTGNFGILAAVAVPALITATGLAVDVSNAMRLKAHLQNASDAAVLAVTQKGRHITEGDAFLLADSYLSSNANVAAEIRSLTLEDSEWRMEVSSSYSPYFEGFLGLQTMDLTVFSTASFSIHRFEIALVLDTTGSMAQGSKMRDMKRAAIELVEGMTGGVREGIDDGLQFSVVPFAQFVNVGPQYAPTILSNGTVSGGADWLDRFGQNRHLQRELPVGLSRFSLYRNMSQTWPGCVETRVPVGGMHYDVEDIEPNPGNSDSLFVPHFNNSEPSRGINRYATDHRNADRNPHLALTKYGVPNANNLDPRTFNRVSIDTGYLSQYGERKGPGMLCNREPLLRLTNDFEAVKGKIDELQPQGGTNILEGVMWGWRTLTHRKPFADGKPPSDETVRKVMILLTDGSNDMIMQSTSLPWNSMYSAIGFAVDRRFASQNASRTQINRMIDDKVELACGNAKKAGIEIYTIRLELNDVGTGNLLRNCASTPDLYFDAPSSSQLKGIFDNIKSRIQGVLLTS